MGGTVVLADGTPLFLYEHAQGGGANPATGKTFVDASALMVARSSDGGETLDPVFKVADIQTSYNKPHTRTVTAAIAADRSTSKFTDRVYVVWGDVRTGRTEIMLSISSDRGTTWTAPIVVSDAPATTRASGGPDQFMPTIAVNKNGTVGVLWYDRRDSDDNLSYYARFSASTDGGVTWLPSVRVSESSHKAAGKSGTGVTGGDTAGLAASADGIFHALWIDNRTGTQQVWTSGITVRSR
jgi:Neuraminidase (sialidase)